MERILNHINQKLREHKIQLDILAVQAEYVQVHQKWLQVVDSIKVPIKYLIIGEATVSWANYFYNEQAKNTSFLNPLHFIEKNNKEELLSYFQREGILVFDLYPLPLPTFIYKSIKFDCSDSLYHNALLDYFDQVKPLIDDNTKILIRYSGLMDRTEFTLFSKFIDELYVGPTFTASIAGQNEGADKEKIKKIFGI